MRAVEFDAEKIMQKWRIVDVTVTKVLELEAAGGTRFILPQATREAVRPMRWMYPHFMDEEGRLKMSIHALVVEAPGRRILVDTCLGNGKQREIPTWANRQGPFLHDLAAAGFERSTIDGALHAHARRSRRLEHDAERRPLGADVSECVTRPATSACASLQKARKR